LELLVAMAIFAAIAAMTYQGLAAMIATRERTEHEGKQLATLQSALTMMGRDMEQMIDRPIRDAYATPQPAVVSPVGEQGAIEFSRGGVPNPANRARSTMQRVGYRLSGHTLIRESWPGVDQVANTEPALREIVAGVDEFHLRFLDSRKLWLPSWPPEGEAADSLHLLPQAVEVTLVLAEWGTISRLFLPAGRP
jgi:general secretion pathway protein J